VQSETVKIVQVNFGVKLVEAETMLGAIFGLGFVQAKDRLWQLNFYRYLTSGRISELIGPAGVPIDKYVRTIGIPRAARKHLAMLDDEELNFLQNYCNGINKAAEHVSLYPLEFYIFMTGFEEYEPIHALSQMSLLSVFLTKDFALEYLRSRLTEIYDRQLVDRLLPFQKEHYFDLGKMETISDDELVEHGFHSENDADGLFTINEELYHIRQKTKKSLDAIEDFPHLRKSFPFTDLVSSWSSLGSNCWAVHGNFTKYGKPILSCDPHLVRYTSPTWYGVRLRWNETVIEQTENGPEERN
jgi:penicillin G amidase